MDLEMEDVLCPYCGEIVSIALDPSNRGVMIHDCEVCCNPWQLTVFRDEDGELRARAECSQ